MTQLDVLYTKRRKATPILKRNANEQCPSFKQIQFISDVLRKYAYYRQITLDKALLEIKKMNGIEIINSYYDMNIKPYIVAKRLLK